MNSENLKKIRMFKGYSRKQLADSSGINTTTLWKIEVGKVDPSVGTIEKIANALDVNIAIFFGETIDFNHQTDLEALKTKKAGA